MTEREANWIKTLVGVLFICGLLALMSGAHERNNWDRVKDGERPSPDADTLAVNLTGVASPATKEQLLSLLKQVPEGALLQLGYRGDDGDFHQLSEADLKGCR